MYSNIFVDMPFLTGNEFNHSITKFTMLVINNWCKYLKVMVIRTHLLISFTMHICHSISVTYYFSVGILMKALPMLNPSPPGETDDGQTHSPSSVRRKWTTDRRTQTGQIGPHGIGGDNIGLIFTPLI